MTLLIEVCEHVVLRCCKRTSLHSLLRIVKACELLCIWLHSLLFPLFEIPAFCWKYCTTFHLTSVPLLTYKYCHYAFISILQVMHFSQKGPICSHGLFSDKHCNLTTKTALKSHIQANTSYLVWCHMQVATQT